MQIDDFLSASLLSLYSCEEQIEDPLSLQIPFGNIAFIKERFWKFGAKYRESGSKRTSHPGLSVSSTANLVAFGTSKTSNRDHSNPNYFFVAPKDCPIIKKDCLFITNITIPGDLTMIDRTQTYYEPLTEAKMQELRNAGFK